MNRIIFACLGLMLLCIGCEQGDKVETATTTTSTKKPRPVEVRTLRRTPPPAASLVSAAAASWKTEDIGFEVSGRIEWVVEPNTDIEGRVKDSEGKLIIQGTPVARIDSQRYMLQVETAEAEVDRAKQGVAVAEIELEKSLTSQMRAAEADKRLAKTEYERSQRLYQQNAGAEADVDRDEANYQTAISKIEQLEASKKAKAAELESLRLQIKQAEQSLEDAQRSLNDCTLYSSFRGQIAKVAVVPGSVVSANNPVATIQMMDPIKIEVEVSAADSRRLRKRQRLPILVTLADGSISEEDGFLYLVDSVADPLTRTFTLTLLMINRKTVDTAISEGENNIATTDQAWRLDFSFLPGSEAGMTFANEEAIHEDDEGSFVWRIENMQRNGSLPADRMLKVSKLRVELVPFKLPFLGNWIFQQIKISDESFDASSGLIAGKLFVNEGEPNDWNGDTMLIDRSSQWIVRPGDLVKVNLSSDNVEPGYYVPMDAIAHDGDRTYLYVVDQTDSDSQDSADSSSTVKRVEIQAAADSTATDGAATSSLRRIEPVGDDPESLAGKRYVSRGVHYLRDGEAVKVTTTREAAQ